MSSSQTFHLFNNFSLLHWNIRSVNSNKSDLFKLIATFQPDIISLVETWIKPNCKLILNNYNIICSNREDGKGGVALCIKNSIQYTQIKINITNMNNLQFLCI